MACHKIDLEKPKGLARGRVEVKTFVQEDLPLYHNLVLKYIPGAKPELLLLNYNFEELDRVNLVPMTRKEINQLLLRLGFYKKESPNDQVPNTFYHAPMMSRPIKQLDSLVGEPFQKDETEELDESDELKQDL